MQVTDRHYHVWVLRMEMKAGGAYFYFNVHPSTYVHRTSAYRVRRRFIAEGVLPGMVQVRECKGEKGSPCLPADPEQMATDTGSPPEEGATA